MTQPNQKKANSKTYSPEVRERAIRLVLDHRASYALQWEAIKSIAPKIGCTAETLRGWVRQHERDSGQRPGLSSEERQRIKALEREVVHCARPMRSCARHRHRLFFAQAERDRRFKL